MTRRRSRNTRPTVEHRGWTRPQQTMTITGWTIRLRYAKSSGREGSFVAFSSTPGKSIGGYVFLRTRREAREECARFRAHKLNAFVAKMIIHLSVETSEAGR